MFKLLYFLNKLITKLSNDSSCICFKQNQICSKTNYIDSDVFSSQIKKNTNKIQRGQVNKWFDELDRFENEYKEQLTQLKELQTYKKLMIPQKYH